MRIAIIGTGISGLYAAHVLQREHDITIFEAEDRVGGHTHTVEIQCGAVSHAVDTGFIVYNEKTYPGFTRLLAELGVESQPTEMSFGVRCDRTGIEWASRGLGSVFAQRSNLLRPSFLRMLRDVVRFNEEAPRLLEVADEKVALGEWVEGAGYSEAFVDHYLVPMGAAIWSATRQDFLRFPALSFVRFFRNHGLLETRPRVPWRVVRGGSSRYAERLVEVFRGDIRLASPVRAVRRQRRYVEVASSGQVERFDACVLAVHSDQALRLLTDPSGLERRVLSSIRYQPNDVVLHTDASLLPRSERAWASWNYRVSSSPGSPVCVTYDMNRLQGIEAPERFLVTLNGGSLIDDERVLRRFTYHHPVLDTEALEAQKLRGRISGVSRTHYCGAYWGYGFHEDGVRSAAAVCRELGVEP